MPPGGARDLAKGSRRAREALATILADRRTVAALDRVLITPADLATAPSCEPP